MGYAIILQGAIELVECFQKTKTNVDGQMSRLCITKEDMVCLSVWPHFITAVNTKSNIDHDGDDHVAQDHDSSPIIVNHGPALQYSA